MSGIVAPSTEEFMSKGLLATQSIFVRAHAADVWNALQNPQMIKQYLFGTDVSSDWKVGSSITYRGVWKGTAYEDKGTILRIVPEKILESTYWSSMSGIPDLPENYKTVKWELTPTPNGVTLTVSQDNNANDEEKNHSEQNWKFVLDSIKALVEKQHPSQ